MPLSLGAPHEVKDKKGNASLAFDVAVNSEVVHDCIQDKTGSFRNFVCELAIEYIDQKVRQRTFGLYSLTNGAHFWRIVQYQTGFTLQAAQAVILW